MSKADKGFYIALVVLVVMSAGIAFIGKPVYDHIAFARLESPAAYQGHG
jgi:hypothetical protein